MAIARYRGKCVYYTNCKEEVGIIELIQRAEVATMQIREFNLNIGLSDSVNANAILVAWGGGENLDTAPYTLILYTFKY